MALFDKSYDRVPDLLRGKILHTPQGRFTINAAEGYSRKENDAGLYRPILGMPPGGAYFPRRRNAILFLIACRDGMAHGGCVLIREVLSASGGVFTGPAAVSEAVGVTVPKTAGRVVELASGDLKLELPGAASAASGSGGNGGAQGTKRPPGIGPKALEALMPQIAERYFATASDTPFPEYLEGLLGRCATEAELRQALRG